MIINFRYHAFTIAAIFAALGIGILIGSSLIGHDGLIEEQKKLISNIGLEINNLREDNLSLRNNIQRLKLNSAEQKQSIEDLLSYIIKNYLGSKSYYVIGDFTEEYNKELAFLKNNFKFNLMVCSSLNEIKKNINYDGVIINNKEDVDLVKNKINHDKIIVYNKQNIYGLILKLIKDENFEKG